MDEVHKFLVCGASGYLGRNLCDYLLKKGHIVTGVDVSPWTGGDCGNFTFLQADLSDSDSWRKIPGGYKAIYYLTGLSGTAKSFSNYEGFVKVNELSLLHLLDLLKDKDKKPRVIFPSSRLVYRGSKGLPLPEDAAKESKTIYAATKIACEAYLEAYRNAFGIDYRVMRLGVPYGSISGQSYSYGTIGFFLNQAKHGEITLYGDGSLRRTFTHVEDVCRQFFALAESDGAKHLVYNAWGEDYSLGEVAQIIAGKFNAKVTYCPFPEMEGRLESGDTIFDYGRMQELLSEPVQHSFKDWLLGL